LGSHNVVYASICETGADRGYFEKVFPGIAGLYHLKAFNALSLIALYRETGEKRQLKLAKQFATSIKGLARAGVSGLTVSVAVQFLVFLPCHSRLS
jgi:hypothetical protein